MLKTQISPLVRNGRQSQKLIRWLTSIPSMFSVIAVLIASPAQAAELALTDTCKTKMPDRTIWVERPATLAVEPLVRLEKEDSQPVETTLEVSLDFETDNTVPKFRSSDAQATPSDRPITTLTQSNDPSPSILASTLPTDGTAAPITASTDVSVAQITSDPADNPMDRHVAFQAGEEGDRWQFSVEPYFFIPLDVNTDITVAGRSVSIDAGLDDVLDLEEAFDGGIRFEARRERFGIMLDGFYLVAGESGTLRVTLPEGSLLRFGIPFAVPAEADASASLRQGTIDLSVFYRVVDTSLGDAEADSYPRLALDPILGIRTNIWRQEIEVDEVRIGPQTFDIDQEFDFSRTTVEPLLGARLQLALSDRWSFEVRGDVSGFNLNAEQDTTWNLLAGAQYDFSSSVGLQLAYGFNGFTFEDGEGLRRAEVDLEQHGLWLSLLFRF